MIAELILKIKQTTDETTLQTLTKELIVEFENLNYPTPEFKLGILKTVNETLKGYFDKSEHSYDSKDLDILMMLSKL